MYNCFICQVMKYMYCSSRFAMITAFLASSYIFVKVFVLFLDSRFFHPPCAIVIATFKYFLRVLAMWCMLRILNMWCLLRILNMWCSLRILNSSALQTFFRYCIRINSGFGRDIHYEDENLPFTNFARGSTVT